MTECLFWLATLGIVYTFVGYPALIVLLARIRPRPVARGPVCPRVSVLIAVHDEARTLAAKLESCLALDYPASLLEIVVACDGCTDATADVARRYAEAATGPAVRVLDCPAWRGKPSVLNDAVPLCAGEIVVLADARQQLEPVSVRALVENFADPSVGAVSGELHLDNVSSAAVGEGVGAYWRYEKLIRRSESAFDSTVGATGAIYAIRRALWTPIPADTLRDDVLVPLWIVRRGYRVVFESGARAHDRVAQTAREEYTRKVRTIAGMLQLFVRERWLVVPAHRLWLQVVSHKLCRLAAPFFLLLAGVTSAALAVEGRRLFQVVAAAQAAFYLVAAAGLALSEARGWRARFVAVPYAFCLLNATTLVSIAYFLAGAQAVTWRKAAERR
jgi:cellulose synthase/poly-beta-1,6-N-acetylglucosamine synthase-like glycosyltransferase